MTEEKAENPQVNLLQKARLALAEIQVRRKQDEALMRVMLGLGINDYEAGETPVMRAIRYFQESKES